MSEPLDVLVVGGGMVGSLFALLLKQGAPTLNIVVIDSEVSVAPSADAPFSLRVSALNQSSEALIARAGCGAALAQMRQCRFTQMQVWDADGTGAVHFQAAEINTSHLGTLIENACVQSLLAQALGSMLQCNRLQSLQRLAHGWQATLADGRVLHPALVVGADGALSRVREAAGIAVTTRDYGQQGLVCTVRTERPHEATAWQRFLPEGPLAFLPLADPHQCSIVWTLPNERAQAMLAADADSFEQALGRAFEFRLGAVSLVGARAAFPLLARHAERYSEQGLVLIGDAAHSIHPLAGQGVNLGLLDAAALADEMLAALTAGLPAHHERALRRYSRARRGHNGLLMHSMSAFEWLFAQDAPIWRVLRNVGMRNFERSAVIKRAVMGVAMRPAGVHTSEQ